MLDRRPPPQIQSGHVCPALRTLSWLLDSANQREVTVKGIHFIQEDSAHKIGRALAGWYKSF